jgi:hypothetical protein
MLAEVIGLEKQLTVPSRDHADLVDLWISMRWNASEVEWCREFNAIVEHDWNNLMSMRALQVVLLTRQQGWVVARSVNPRAVQPAEVENLVRGLVARVNERLVVPPSITTVASPRNSWSTRVRSTLAVIGADVFGDWLTPRRGRDADIASS